MTAITRYTLQGEGLFEIDWLRELKAWPAEYHDSRLIAASASARRLVIETMNAMGPEFHSLFFEARGWRVVGHLTSQKR